MHAKPASLSRAVAAASTLRASIIRSFSEKSGQKRKVVSPIKAKIKESGYPVLPSFTAELLKANRVTPSIGQDIIEACGNPNNTIPEEERLQTARRVFEHLIRNYPISAESCDEPRYVYVHTDIALLMHCCQKNRNRSGQADSTRCFLLSTVFRIF